MKPTDKPVSTPADVTGIILPNRWDKNGRVIEIAIYTGSEEVYGVVHNSLAHQIMMNLCKCCSRTDKRTPGWQHGLPFKNLVHWKKLSTMKKRGMKGENSEREMSFD